MKRALIVDDQQNWIDVLYQIVDEMGFEVSHANTIEGALELLERPFDLVVIDMHLSKEMNLDCNGVLVLEELRKGKYSDLTKIILTDFAFVEEVVKKVKLKYKVNAFISKGSMRLADLSAFKRLINSIMVDGNIHEDSEWYAVEYFTDL